jgi:phosphopantetheinyl transferase (holo-ACP synthase)
MSKPTIRIHDMATGEVVDRVMTDTEYTEWQTQQAEAEAQAAAIAAKEATRQAALDKLGLTADEVAALFG